MLSRILKQKYDFPIQKLLPSISIISLVAYPQRNFTIKKKSSKIWMNEHVNDEYVKKAKLVSHNLFLNVILSSTTTEAEQHLSSLKLTIDTIYSSLVIKL